MLSTNSANARGLGVPRDQTQAAAWYSKAADQGHPVAQYNLGVIYERGQGVTQDYASGRHVVQPSCLIRTQRRISIPRLGS